MEQNTPKFKRTFKGIVHLKEWLKLSNGKSYAGLSGYIHIMPATEAIGFAPADRESNWIALISPEEVFGDDSDFVTVLGCQIRGFERIKYDHNIDADFAQVGYIK